LYIALQNVEVGLIRYTLKGMLQFDG